MGEGLTTIKRNKKRHQSFLSGLELFYLTLILASLSSCLSQSSNGRRVTSGGSITNLPQSVPSGFGRFLQDNPIILSGNPSLASTTNLGTFLSPDPQFITNNNFLIGGCSAGSQSISDCYDVRANNTEGFLTEPLNRWAFPTGTPEFRQVQAFANIRDVTDKFHRVLESSFQLGVSSSLFYPTSHPNNLLTSPNTPFWFRRNDAQPGSGRLQAFSDCPFDNNAFYSPSQNQVCLGNLENFPANATGAFFAQDPTITWHEMGHALIQIMLNTRNLASSQTFLEDVNLGYLFYDEAGSIGEAISDYFSYFVNQRPHIGEWSLGRFLFASRPLTERDPIHVAGVNTSPTGRLSYPTFVNYDPNFPESNIEDVHFAGQIISHFLVALTEDVQSYCGRTLDQSIEHVMHLMIESFAEIGDQTSQGSDFNPLGSVNLNSEHSLTWVRLVNPINFRRFIQSLGKFNDFTIGRGNNCNGGNYPRDRFESLADNYGLLLFRTYNANGNNTTTQPITVSNANRVQSLLIDKSLLSLDPREGRAQAFVVDTKADIQQAVEALQSGGQIVGISPEIEGDFGFNNGNAQISPGEVVGVSLNLFNNSNSTMAGVQVLGNDWDHTKNSMPCNNFQDNFPSASEGAADLSTGEGQEGGCDFITRFNGTNSSLEPNEELAPVCLVQVSNTNSTAWVTQDELMRRLSLDPSRCLGGQESTKDCFIRTIKGAEQAFYSRIPPLTTWAETFVDPDTQVPQLSLNNLIFMEANSFIPPGTTFNCRFRARFTNCDNCFHDPLSPNFDDYLDFEYSGNRPFQIINFQFTVIN